MEDSDPANPVQSLPSDPDAVFTTLSFLECAPGTDCGDICNQSGGGSTCTASCGCQCTDTAKTYDKATGCTVCAACVVLRGLQIGAGAWGRVGPRSHLPART